MEVDTDELLKNVTIGLGGLSFLMIAWSLWRLRKPQRLRWLTPLLAILGSTAGVAVSIVLMGVEVEPIAAAALGGLGAVIGIAALMLIRVELVDGRKFVKRSHWFLALWGLALVGLQVVSALDSPNTLAAGIAGALVSAGLMVTLNLGLLVRRFTPVRVTEG